MPHIYDLFISLTNKKEFLFSKNQCEGKDFGSTKRLNKECIVCNISGAGIHPLRKIIFFKKNQCIIV
jgi:hypothetical protein